MTASAAVRNFWLMFRPRRSMVVRSARLAAGLLSS
jgi:hypothetical protein